MFYRLLPAVLLLALLPFAALAQDTFSLEWEETVITSTEIDSTFLFHGELINTTAEQRIYIIEILTEQVEKPEIWTVQICTHYTCYAPFLSTVGDTLDPGQVDDTLSIDINAFVEEGQAIVPVRIYDEEFPDDFVETTLYLYAGPNDVEDGSGAGQPVKYSLAPVYPNPFNAATNVRFTLPTPGQAVLTLHDITGRQVLELARGMMPAGQHVRSVNANTLASGQYFVRLRAGDREFVQAATLVK